MKFKKTVVLSLLLFLAAFINADDLNTKKMEKATKEILDVFVSTTIGEKSDHLRKYISEDWLERKKLNVNKYKINNYSPDHYNIIYSGGDICAATIGGSTWEHLLVFKFTEEGTSYKVVPKGVSTVSSDYIDPWFYVKDYLCNKDTEEK
ncbi:MAG TPA: hypothetical protein VJ455_07500 [Ignavibacteria bacterium]|nr:hypothetical protein [Ignavibacteria bacterium]